MLLFLSLLGFLALLSLLALVKASLSIRDGYEDINGFHFGEATSETTNTATSGTERQPSHFSEQTAPRRAA